MGVSTIPLRYEHKCDGCGKVQSSSSAGRISAWSLLAISRDALDYQGAACADASITRLLCETCGPVVFDAVNNAVTALARQGATDEA